jgi:hypothetical protein
MGNSTSPADRRPGLADAVTRMVATIRRRLGTDPNAKLIPHIPSTLPIPEIWPYEIPFRALLDPAYGFHCGGAIPFLRIITAALQSVQTLLHGCAQDDLTRLAFEELLSETVCQMSDPVTIDGEQLNLFQPAYPPETALDVLTASLGSKSASDIGLKAPTPTYTSRRNEDRDAEVIRLKKEKPNLTGGQIAALIRKNPGWQTMENDKPFSAGAAKSILQRARKAGQLP